MLVIRRQSIDELSLLGLLVEAQAYMCPLFLLWVECDVLSQQRMASKLWPQNYLVWSEKYLPCAKAKFSSILDKYIYFHLSACLQKIKPNCFASS